MKKKDNNPAQGFKANLKAAIDNMERGFTAGQRNPKVEYWSALSKKTEIIKKAFSMTAPVRITVMGEEDLLVLPVCIYAPDNSIVLYGQPNEGLVLVEINTEIRNKVQTLLDLMN